MSARSMLHRLARLERETETGGCPVCGYAPGAKKRGFVKFTVHVPGVTPDCPDDDGPDQCPRCGRQLRLRYQVKLDSPLDP